MDAQNLYSLWLLALGAVVCFLCAFGGGYLALRLAGRAKIEKSPEPPPDAAALERAMEDVRASAERYRRTVENALDAIVTVDGRGVIVGWNPRAEAIFGWSREEALGEDVFELITRAQDRENTRTGLLSFLTIGGESRLLGRRQEIVGVGRDGREIPIEATYTMAASGDQPEFNLFFQDITERQRAREALQEAKETAEAATRAKTEFLANMSHEIRTPMNGILGIIELMLDAGPSRRQRRYLEMIRASADSLLRLLNDVLDYSKFEAGKIETQALDFKLRRHLVDLLGALAIQAREKGLDLVCRVDRAVPDRLIGDPVRLGQVILNLVANGIKFTTEGEVLVEVSLVSRRSTRAMLEFTVTDTGPGIPMGEHELIFRPFEQSGIRTAQRYGGAGLGLAICRRLARSMGGEIGVDVRSSPGSTFRFRCPFGLQWTPVPAVEADLDTDEPETLPLLDVVDSDGGDDEQTEARHEPTLGPGRVLVIEDNRINQVVAEGMLEAWGFETAVASSGTEALGALYRESFDLVLTDMRMPDMDGFAVTAAIRATEKGTRIPIIAMTANVAPGDRQRCLDAGMDGYVVKPIHKPALLAAVQDALKRGAVESPTADDASDEGAAEPRLAPTPDKETFDRETLLRRLGGHDQRAHQLATIFIEEDGLEYRTALAEAFAEHDRAAIREAAHALRGAAGEICAPAVVAAAERLEAAVQEQDTRRLEKKYETLEREIEKLSLKLEAFLKEPPTTP